MKHQRISLPAASDRPASEALPSRPAAGSRAGSESAPAPASPAPGLISAVVTVRNGEAYLREAIDSLLGQTDDRFEVIIVDDGSTDGTAAVLAGYADRRITVKTLPLSGRAAALACGAGMARGEYIAILDADDIALPQRFAEQRAFLEAHPGVALVGSAAIDFQEGREWVEPIPVGPEAVRRALSMYNPFYHSGVMYRTRCYLEVGGYQPDGGWGHDYSLLIRIAARYPVDIMPQPLIRYRHHPAQMSLDGSRETFRRRKSALLQLWAARRLRLPPMLWVFPITGFIYAHLPASVRRRVRLRRLKRTFLRWLFPSSGGEGAVESLNGHKLPDTAA